MHRILAAAALVVVSLGGATPALAQRLVPCAEEGGYCRVPYSTQVVYGAAGRTAARYVDERGIPCSNRAFGDPAPGMRKRCLFVARGGGYGGGYGDDGDFGPGAGRRGGGYGRDREDGDWITCARENGFCDFRGRARVRYGAQGRFAVGVFRDGVPCNNRVFGDPARGIRKACQVLQ